MAAGQLRQVLRRVRRLVGERAADETSDGHLLGRFIRGGDEAAFELLLLRHGPMVLGTCRRTLGDAHLAEDAFQATFLVLVRKAASLRHRDRVAGWLHGVACRVALKARAQAARQRQRQKEMADVPTADTTAAADWRDLRPVLDQEIARLPARYREPFVLAYLEGRTNAEVAQALGCPPGTVFTRLARARQRLRSRLARRGLALSGAALAARLTENTLPAAVPAALARSTLRTAVTLVAGGAVAADGVAALTQGALRDMALTRVRVALLLVLSAGLLGLGAASALHQVYARGEPAAGPELADESDCAPVPDPAARPLPAGAIARIGSPHFRFVRDSIARLAYSPDGKFLAVAGYGNQLETVIVVWDAATGKEARRFHRKSLEEQTTGRIGSADRISALAFSPDGKVLAWAVSWPEKVIYLWDAATGKELHALKGSQAPLAFSPDSKTLAGVGSDGTVRLWSVATGKERRALPGSAGPVAFTADGKWLATGGADRLIHVWEAASGKEVRSLAVGMEKQRQEAGIFPESFTFAPSGPLLALRWGVRPPFDRGGPGTSYHSTTVQVWDASNGKKVLEVAEGNGRSGLPWESSAFLAFAPDGRTLYARGLNEQVVHALEVTAKLRVRPAELAQIEGVTQPAVLSPDGQTLASWEGRSVRLWATGSGKEKVLHAEGHSDTVHQLAVAPDGKTLVSASADRTVGVWDLTSGQALRRVRPVHSHPYVLFALALGGKAVVVRGLEGFTTWDLATGKQLHPGEDNVLPRAGWAPEFEVSPDGRTLAWEMGGKVRLANLATNKELPGFEDGMAPRGLAFSPDGKSLAQAQEVALGTGSCRVLVRDLPGGTVRTTIPPSGGLRFPRVRFLPDGQALVTDDEAGVRVWGLKTGKEIRQLAGRRWAGFSPDGKVIVTATADTLIAQETASGKELFRLPAPGGPWKQVVFSPNGKVLAVPDLDGAIRLIDVATGKERRALRGHQGAVRALAFSRDGKVLASGSADTTILLWDVKDTAR
jgi:RNA polymerase sigma factor (sigma-70 family)